MMPISLGFWEWGCPKRKDAHITVTADNAAHRVNLSTGKRNWYPFIQWIALSSFERLGPDLQVLFYFAFLTRFGCSEINLLFISYPDLLLTKPKKTRDLGARLNLLLKKKKGSNKCSNNQWVTLLWYLTLKRPRNPETLQKKVQSKQK